jgi:hypothetical protein
MAQRIVAKRKETINAARQQLLTPADRFGDPYFCIGPRDRAQSRSAAPAALVGCSKPVGQL